MHTHVITSEGGGFFFTGLRTGWSDFSGCTAVASEGDAAGFLATFFPVVAAAFLGLLALGGATLISTFSLISSIYMHSINKNICDLNWP